MDRQNGMLKHLSAYACKKYTHISRGIQGKWESFPVNMHIVS